MLFAFWEFWNPLNLRHRLCALIDARVYLQEVFSCSSGTLLNVADWLQNGSTVCLLHNSKSLTATKLYRVLTQRSPQTDLQGSRLRVSRVCCVQIKPTQSGWVGAILRRGLWTFELKPPNLATFLKCMLEQFDIASLCPTSMTLLWLTTCYFLTSLLL